MTTIQTWTRRDLELAAEQDQPEGTTMLKVAISPRMLLLLMDYQSERREGRVEVVAASGDPTQVELKFFYRDGPPEADDDPPETYPEDGA